MRLPFHKSMYAQHTDKHFKLYCPVVEDGMFINIYVKTKEDTPVIFNELISKYKLRWMSEYEAAIKAKETVNDFFDCCVDLSKKQQRPFKLRIVPIDKERIKK